MRRLIDADVLKQHIDKLPALPDGNFAGNHSALKALINTQPTIQPEPQWIPVSERLPKEGQVVLITNKNGNVKYGQYRGLFPSDAVNWWWWKKNTTEEVTAWMPLPEPYKAERRTDG